MHEQVYSTFWQGERLSKFEIACLNSFANRGLPVRLYSFSRVVNCPTGIELIDAREIAEPASTEFFLVDGKPNMSHYSDYFRVLLFMKTGCTWIDADILLLDSARLPNAPTLFAKEDSGSICGAIMRIGNDDSKLPLLLEKVSTFIGKDLAWGDTGPRLLTKLFGSEYLDDLAFDYSWFYPIHYRDYWKVFLPSHLEECQRLASSAATLHLWNNLVEKLGIWKEIGPPCGSFLHSVFLKAGCIDIFDQFYPENVMEIMVQNFLYRIDMAGRFGPAKLGVRSLYRLIGPSIKWTLLRKSSQQ